MNRGNIYNKALSQGLVSYSSCATM